jgi:hypothetical protein
MPRRPKGERRPADARKVGPAGVFVLPPLG